MKKALIVIIVLGLSILWIILSNIGNFGGPWEKTTWTVVESLKMDDWTLWYVLEYDIIVNPEIKNAEGEVIKWPIKHNVFWGTKQVKKGQKIEVRYTSNDPMNYRIVWNLEYVK